MQGRLLFWWVGYFDVQAGRDTLTPIHPTKMSFLYVKVSSWLLCRFVPRDDRKSVTKRTQRLDWSPAVRRGFYSLRGYLLRRIQRLA